MLPTVAWIATENIHLCGFTAFTSCIFASKYVSYNWDKVRSHDSLQTFKSLLQEGKERLYKKIKEREGQGGGAMIVLA
jgi:hypothetical protein